MIISVSGFGWSGSGAVYDLLSEYSDVQVALEGRSHFEFSLLSDTDGISDLNYHLIERPCRISSYVAFIRFLHLVESYCKYFNAERSFDNQFMQLAKEYINALTDFQFEGATHYERFQMSPFVSFYNEMIRKIFANRFTKKVWGYKYRDYQINALSDIRVSYRPDSFLEITKDYLNKLFSILQDDRRQPLLFDQMIPADNPLPCLKYLDNPRCIVVRRDPRDTYLLGKVTYKQKRLPIPTDNVEDFIVFYRKIVQNTIVESVNSVLNIKYEDLIYQYDKTIKQIEHFLGISAHDKPRSKFDPSVSISNTQLFKKYDGYEDDIRRIEEELPETLYPFENYPSIEPISSRVF